ncbi:hypothetical protein QF035_009070 [Streptomyces umbrinus]|uniref:DUF742 domain-containing protein n=1 Tax=Streptomyces umbrinus TaxID=67370 RepID=A0ABU0T6R8_9ACTN|nr:DUF742 domain-containing protein [Streptomyces umbrinus]MDQ1031488.1 hypothetical protein [Streptomyces umbrinus]
MARARGAPWSVVDGISLRPYEVAGGRTRSRHSENLRLETVLEPGTRPPPGPLRPETQQILGLCSTQRRSIAELSGSLSQPVPVVRVLVSDLLDASALQIPPASGFSNSRHIMQAALEGLRRKWTDDEPTAC